jgi:acyl-homoserine lactone acylase PvdQ
MLGYLRCRICRATIDSRVPNELQVDGDYGEENAMRIQFVAVAFLLALVLNTCHVSSVAAQESVKSLAPPQSKREAAAAVRLDHLPGQGPDIGSAVVYRDAWGVAHLYAPTVEAAMYAKGWAQAEDRPEQLLRNYLMGMGELASVDGEAALRSDIVSRMFEHYAQAKLRADTMVRPELLGHLDAFVAGVQDYFKAHPNRCRRGGETGSLTATC